MSFRRLIGYVLAIFVIAGLVAAPLASPVAAMGPSSVAMSDMASMSGDMPCCPDTQKNKDCKDCPLLAVCMIKNLAARPAVEAVVLRLAKHHQIAAPDDVMSDGLNRPPPDHPPRTLV
ncbi:MAG: hypothetical protein J0I08_05770 [Rhizobiales bacterium]|nr:hypothetical protein [Hyphomicrobiales bacterium]